ncbi:MAG: hypothetical protein ABIG60_02240 [Patescibacteria group bacterium]
MRLSRLQKYILTQCLQKKNDLGSKSDFYHFYSKNELEKNLKNIQDIIHRSLDSLILKDLVIAFGRKTAKKWFISKIKLTSRGKKIARELIKNRQRKLPIK